MVADEDGVVENVVIWDGEAEWNPGEGRSVHRLASDHLVSVGDRYVDGVFVRPTPPDDDIEEG